MKIEKSIFWKLVVISIIFVSVVFILRATQFDWNNVPRLACQLNGNCNDCEKDLDSSFVHEIVNTLSNLIYILVGFYIYFKYTTLKYRKLILAGFCTIAIASSFYHASTSLPGLVSDFIGINILLSILALTVLSIKYKFKDLFLGLFGIFNSANILLTTNAPESDLLRYIMTGISAVVLILSLFRQLFQKEMLIAVGFYILGVICWQIDGRRIFCDPNSILQFHSLWHICLALSGLFIVKTIAKLESPIKK